MIVLQKHNNGNDEIRHFTIIREYKNLINFLSSKDVSFDQ